MAITRETVEREIEGSKQTISKYKEGIAIHEIVLKAFEEHLKLFPTKPKKKE